MDPVEWWALFPLVGQLEPHLRSGGLGGLGIPLDRDRRELDRGLRHVMDYRIFYDRCTQTALRKLAHRRCRMDGLPSRIRRIRPRKTSSIDLWFFDSRCILVDSSLAQSTEDFCQNLTNKIRVLTTVSHFRNSIVFSSESMSPIVNIAAYQYVALDALEERRAALKMLTKSLELRGTILLSHEGINMFVAGTRSCVDSLLSHVRNMHPELVGIAVKESITDYQPFRRMLVKIKKEIIPVGAGGVLEVETQHGPTRVEPVANASPKIKPTELKQWLDEGRDITLLDTRNVYETELGTFDHAIDLRLKTFREFPEAAAKLPDEVKKKPVVMFCTGGIRCEKIGPYMKGLGFETIFQLEGGILKYFEDCQQAHYQGDCFVFDQRVAVNPGLAPSEAFECYACRHVLTREETESEKYKECVSCPYCYVDPLERRKAHQAKIASIAQHQAGCIPYENRRWISIAQRFDGWQLVDALDASFPAFGRDAWLTTIQSGLLQCPRRQFAPASESETVRAGQRFLQIILDYTEPPVSSDVELVFEDESIIVVNKGAPLPVHPSGRFNKNTLLTILETAYGSQRLHPCHRLDANTTGLIIFARHHKDSSKIQNQFSNGTVQKTYLVHVEGIVPWDQNVCNLAILPEPLPSGGRCLGENGQPATTEFQVVSRQCDSTVLMATPLTGRTHQIRIHASALGFPVKNDPLYLQGGLCRSRPDDDLSSKPIGLHAWRLRLRHPVTDEPIAWEATPPASFAYVCENKGTEFAAR
jgi:UPF0176 protein